jgi:hypothetical protein
MFKKLKHGTTVMMESMRKHEGPLSLREDFQSAADQFKSIQQTISTFIDDAQNILKVFPALTKHACTFSATTSQIFQTFPENERILSDEISILTTKLQDFTEGQGKAASDIVLSPLRDLLEQVNELAAIQTAQKDSFLILESNKSKLEALLKEPEKNGLKIEQYQEKIRARRQTVQELEEEFISRMNAIWNNRFDVLNRPLMALMDTILDLGQLAREGAEALANLLGPEIVGADYPSVPIPEKGKK